MVRVASPPVIIISATLSEPKLNETGDITTETETNCLSNDTKLPGGRVASNVGLIHAVLNVSSGYSFQNVTIILQNGKMYITYILEDKSVLAISHQLIITRTTSNMSAAFGLTSTLSLL